MSTSIIITESCPVPAAGKEDGLCLPAAGCLPWALPTGLRQGQPEQHCEWHWIRTDGKAAQGELRGIQGAAGGRK